MKGNMKYFFMGMLVIVVVFSFGTVCAADESSAKEVTITGSVNDNFQIVTDDGTTYEIDINDLGNELVEKVGKKVKVTGTVDVVDDIKAITVTSYEEIGE